MRGARSAREGSQYEKESELYTSNYTSPLTLAICCPVAALSLHVAARRCTFATLSLAAILLPLLLPGVLHEENQHAHEHSHQICEQLHRVGDEVTPTVDGLLDDELCVEDDVPAEDEESEP